MAVIEQFDKLLAEQFKDRDIEIISVLIICVPFQCGVWGSMWNSIVSVPVHCLFIYIVYTEPENHLTVVENKQINY